jgi:type IV pilus assembly protein PilW
MSNNKARIELEKTSRQIENGRYAMQLLTEDLQMAGFFGAYVPTSTTASANLMALTAQPDPCATDPTADDAWLLHIQGYDNGGSAPTCLSDLKSGTDIVVVRRVSTCAAGSANCDAFLSGAPHMQVSGCTTDTASYRIDGTQSNLTLKKVGCTATGDIRRYRTHIYFIANNNIGTDGVPTLKRAELGAGAFSIVPLVEGIENLQLEYGIDNNGDGVPDTYTAAPDSYVPGSLPPTCTALGPVCNWWNVMAVKVNVLARNTQSTPAYTDAKTYTLGLDASGNPNTFSYGDAYKRHAYSAAVRLANPAGRRQ